MNVSNKKEVEALWSWVGATIPFFNKSRVEYRSETVRSVEQARVERFHSFLNRIRTSRRGNYFAQIRVPMDSKSGKGVDLP